MFTRKRILIGGGIVVALGLAAVAAVGVWYVALRDDPPPAVNLADAVAAVQGQSQTQAPSQGQSQSQGTPPAPASPAATATDASTAVATAAPPVTATQAAGGARSDGLAGTWVLAPNSGSFVGYRVKEELARIGAATAVGRTSKLTASLEFNGSAITNVQVTADLTALQSDQALRDDQLRRQALETSRFPTATFTLTQPIQLSSVPAEGVQVNATAIGDLTLHGVTRSVSIPLQGQLVSGRVVVVGSLDIPFADFNIAQPSAGSVLSVEDHGLLELQLVFQRGTQ